MRDEGVKYQSQCLCVHILIEMISGIEKCEKDVNVEKFILIYHLRIKTKTRQTQIGTVTQL